MNLFWILFASFPFLELTEETIQSIALPQDSYDSPIALIRKQGSTRLQLAAPVKYEPGEYWKRALYAYNDSADEHGPAEEFRTACPPAYYDSDEKRIEKEWKAKNEPSEYGSLFFVEEDHWMNVLSCSVNYNIKPSIQKITDDEGAVESCGPFAAEMWGVGFPVIFDNWLLINEPVSKSDQRKYTCDLSRENQVSDKAGKNPVQFLPVFKVCYSVSKGLLYTVHHLNSPNLLLVELWEYYELNPIKDSYSYVLDSKDKDENMESSYQDHYAYQFVPDEDMPTKNLHNSTYFRFNYFPVPKHQTLLKGLIRADNYIRLYSKETKKPLTTYSGSYQKPIQTKLFSCAPNTKCEPTVLKVVVDSFWKIIKDEENNAILLVTQVTPVKCNVDEGTFILCDENRTVMQQYLEGGCTYTCSLNTEIINQLELPTMEITGTLNLSFTKKVETEKSETPGSQAKSPGAKSSSKMATMQDFMKSDTFLLALTNYDGSLAKTMTVHDASPSPPSSPPKKHGFWRGIFPRHRGNSDDGSSRSDGTIGRNTGGEE